MAVPEQIARMNLQRYVQEFTDADTGKVDGVTFEPIEIWTAAGLVIIPPGCRFSFNDLPETARRLLRDDEIPLCILREWQQTAGKQPDGAAGRVFRRELIQRARKRQRATEGRFWAFLKDRARVEVISCMVRLFGIIARWYILKK